MGQLTKFKTENEDLILMLIVKRTIDNMLESCNILKYQELLFEILILTFLTILDEKQKNLLMGFFKEKPC